MTESTQNKIIQEIHNAIDHIGKSEIVSQTITDVDGVKDFCIDIIFDPEAYEKHRSKIWQALLPVAKKRKASMDESPTGIHFVRHID